MEHSADAAGRVGRHLPGVKLILALRNPVDRAYSHFSHMVRWFGHRWDLEKCLEYDLANGTSRGIQNEDFDVAQVKSAFCSHGLYLHSIRQWLRHFPRQQLHVVSSEQLFSQTPHVMKSMFEFLQLSPHRDPRYVPTNKSGIGRLGPQLRSQLESYFAPANAALSELLGIDFGW